MFYHFNIFCYLNTIRKLSNNFILKYTLLHIDNYISIDFNITFLKLNTSSISKSFLREFVEKILENLQVIILNVSFVNESRELWLKIMQSNSSSSAASISKWLSSSLTLFSSTKKVPPEHRRDKFQLNKQCNGHFPFDF